MLDHHVEVVLNLAGLLICNPLGEAGRIAREGTIGLAY